MIRFMADRGEYRVVLRLAPALRAWALALIMVVVSLWSGFTGTGGGVAHFAHLGGLAVGFSYLKAWEWRKGSARREFQRKLNRTPSGGGVAAAVTGDGAALSRWEQIDIGSLHELNREEVELLLEKARTRCRRRLPVAPSGGGASYRVLHVLMPSTL